MKIKFVEIRDRMTFIPAMAVEMTGAPSAPADWLMRRAGYGGGGRCIILIHLNHNLCKSDPYEWGDRTMMNAHNYIDQHWEEILDGEVVDVEFILGETDQKKVSERFD